MRFLERFGDGGEVGGDPRGGRWTGIVSDFGEDDVDDRRRDALDERRCDPFCAKQEAGERRVVLGHGLRAVLDRGLRPCGARHRVGVESEVALVESSGDERARPPASPEDGYLDACELHGNFRTVSSSSVRY
ncbi:MAG: hypothetical protein M3Q48_03140 [Actinomycetota bacterium]|nr:hypothetical protein [Actinomycetota bacterium]